MIFCECRLKTHNSVHWDDVTIIDEGETRDEVVFTEAGSPSESLMGKTVFIDVPHRNLNGSRIRGRGFSLPPPAVATSIMGSHIAPHSLFTENA
jgi:hypothetical protein